MNPHARAFAYQRMVADNTLDVAAVLVRRTWKPRPTPIAERLLQARHTAEPTWLARQRAGD